MIVGILGLKDSGKTLVMSWLLALEHFNYGNAVLSNYLLNFPSKIINVQEVVELRPNLKNAAIGIDEIQTIADSRRHGKKQNILLGHFILQSRHRSVNLYFTSQFENQYDKRIRQNTDIKIICENLYIDSDGDGHDDLFRIIVQDARRTPPLIEQRIIYGKPLFKMYDTDYIIDIFHLPKDFDEEQIKREVFA